MSELILSSTSRVQVTAHHLIQAVSDWASSAVERAHNEQTGQDMVEYAGVLIVVAAIVLAMATFGKPIASSIAKGITTEISKIFSS